MPQHFGAELMMPNTSPALVRSHGSVTGRLVVDADTGTVSIVHPLRKEAVEVAASPDPAETLRSCSGRRVTLTGLSYSRRGEVIPDRIEAESLRIFPDGPRPKLSELRGSWPKATGDLTSEEFVRRLRDE